MRYTSLGGRVLESLGLVCLYGLTSFDDIRTKQVRLNEIIIFAVLGIALNIAFPSKSALSILGGVGVGLGLLIFSILSKEKIGKGDAYIIMVTGLYLGFINTLVLLWISCIFAAVIGVITLRKYDNSKCQELPFVPFLLMGYLSLFTLQMFRGGAV